MKNINRMHVFAWMLLVFNVSYAGLYYQYSPAQNNDLKAHLYNKNINHADRLAAQRLTAESCFSPEIQWAILLFLGQQGMTINIITGAVEGLPSFDVILKKINQELQGSITSSQKEIIKNALHAMLETTEVALFTAQIEANLQNQNFIFNQNINTMLITALQAQKQGIQDSLAVLTSIIPTDEQPSQSSYFSWIPYFGTNSNAKQPVALSSGYESVNPHASTVTMKASLMPTIIATNDYKEEIDPVKAANLLFKQCFIAQQHHIKDMNRIEKITINLQGNINAKNYIYTKFPDFERVCQIAQDLVPQDQYRDDVQSRMSPQQRESHQLLLHIRQAIQTALFIANDKSSYNVGTYIPSTVASYLLKPIVNQLIQYDTQMSNLCKEPQYGATQDDIYRDEQWASMGKYALSTVITTAVVGTAIAFNPTLLPAAGSVISGAAGKAVNYLPSWLGGGTTTPVEGPDMVDGTKPANNTSWMPSLNTVAQYGKTASMVGGMVAQVGAQQQNGALQQAGQYLSTAGTLAGGLTGSISDVGGAIGAVSSFAPGQYGAVGSAIGSTAKAIGAANDVYEKGFDMQKGMNAYMMSTDALNKIAHAQQSLAAPAGSTPSNNVTIKVLTPQEIYKVMLNITAQTMTQGQELMNKLRQFLGYVLQNKMAEPQMLSQMISSLPQQYPDNENVSAVVGQLTQALAQ